MLLIFFICSTLKFLTSYLLDLVSVFIFFCTLLKVNDYFQSGVDRTIDGIVIGMNNSHVKPFPFSFQEKRDIFEGHSNFLWPIKQICSIFLCFKANAASWKCNKLLKKGRKADSKGKTINFCVMLKRLVWKLSFLEKTSTIACWFIISYDHRNEVKHFFVSCSVTLILRSASRLIVRLQVFKQVLSNTWWCCRFWTSLHATALRNVLVTWSRQLKPHWSEM